MKRSDVTFRLTFALSMGDAFESSTWRTVLPEIVSKDDLGSAAALDGIEFNFARAIGPAWAGFIIAAAGIGTAFAINTATLAAVPLLASSPTGLHPAGRSTRGISLTQVQSPLVISSFHPTSPAGASLDGQLSTAWAG